MMTLRCGAGFSRPQLEISGILRLEGSTPPSEHRGAMHVTLLNMEIGMSAHAAVDPDGSFKLNVTPAEYQINAFCGAGAYPKSAHFGDQELAGEKSI